MYNANKSKEIEQISAGETTTAIIIEIIDGKVKDFMKTQNLSKFENTEQTAINLIIEFKYKERNYKIENMITYFQDEEGNTMLSKNSKLSKYKAFYKKLPEVGDQIKVVTDANGYFKIML